MKTYLKLCAVFMAFSLFAFSFAGCSSKKDNAATTSATASDTSATIPTTAVPTTTSAPTTIATTEPPPTFADVVVLDCTKPDYNKIGSSIKVQSSAPDPAPGQTAYWYSKASVGDVVLQAVIPPFDATQNNYMTGALKLEVWCSDITLIGTENQFEFNTKTNDVDENSWNWTSQITQNGWNTIYLPWDEANVSDNPDYSALTWIRMYDVGRKCDYAIGSIMVVPISEVQ